MKKPHRLIRGADIGTLRIGERAQLLLYSGKVIRTSPVVNCFYSGKYVFVETRNSIYETRY